MRALLVVAATVLMACGTADSEPGARPTATPTLAGGSQAGTRVVIDMTGRRAHVGESVRRVVAISPSANEFAVALGLEVIGRTSDSGGSGGTVVGSTINPDFAAMATLEPDLVIADAAFHGSRSRDFDQFPYPVFVIRVNSYNDVLATFDALGEATGTADRANASKDALVARHDGVVARTSGKSARVLILTGAGTEVYAGSDATYLGSLIRALGATNVLGATPVGAPIAGFGVVEVSQVASTNPDVILVLPSGAGGLANEILASPLWAGTPAVRNRRVFELDRNLYLRSPGPRAGEALDELADKLYGTR